MTTALHKCSNHYLHEKNRASLCTVSHCFSKRADDADWFNSRQWWEVLPGCFTMHTEDTEFISGLHWGAALQNESCVVSVLVVSPQSFRIRAALCHHTETLTQTIRSNVLMLLPSSHHPDFFGIKKPENHSNLTNMKYCIVIVFTSVKTSQYIYLESLFPFSLNHLLLSV